MSYAAAVRTEKSWPGMETRGTPHREVYEQSKEGQLER